ncbi:MAG: histidinol-phosphate transaminase [Actinomycetota bacterium]|nr:histidinol-phosphate transaminase [Actinomycetota bacterium]
MKDIFRKELEALRPYSPGKPIADVKRELGLSEVIKLASNESPTPPLQAAVEAIASASLGINRYPDGACLDLKSALSRHLEVEESTIIVGNGSNELIRLLAQAVLNSGDEVVMASPSFVVYPTVSLMMNAHPVEVSLTGHRHDLAAMRSAITEKTKMVFICNPNNPTGTIVSRSEVEEFLNGTPDHVMVVFDEAYFEYVDDPDFASGLKYFSPSGGVVVLRTFSKIFGLAGLRIGYGVAPKEVVTYLDKIREPFNVNSLAQVGALASLREKEEVATRKTDNLAGLKFLSKALSEMGFEAVPSSANFLLVDVKEDSKEVFGRLLKKGVIVRSGEIFGEAYTNFIRVTVGSPEENKKFILALKEVTGR